MKYENSRLEIKQLKSEICSLNVDKISLSAACKTSKKEIQEVRKEFEKKQEMCDHEIDELREYKKNKLGLSCAKLKTSWG